MYNIIIIYLVHIKDFVSHNHTIIHQTTSIFRILKIKHLRANDDRNNVMKLAVILANKWLIFWPSRIVLAYEWSIFGYHFYQGYNPMLKPLTE